MYEKHLRTLMDTYGHKKILEEIEKKLLIKPEISRDALMLPNYSHLNHQHC